MIHSALHFVARTLSAKNGDPSSTRMALMLVVLTLCAFVWAIIFVSIRTSQIPDIPGGTGLFLGGLLGIVAALKGVQGKTESKDQ